MKRFLIAFLLINILLLSGCRSTISNTEKEIIVSKIHADSVTGLTSEEAVALCQTALGVIDDEDFVYRFSEVHTGRKIGYRCDGAFSFDDKQYYIICMLWSGDNDINWSTIGFLGVSADGKEIREIQPHGEDYSVGEIIWTEE